MPLPTLLPQSLPLDSLNRKRETALPIIKLAFHLYPLCSSSAHSCSDQVLLKYNEVRVEFHCSASVIIEAPESPT